MRKCVLLFQISIPLSFLVSGAAIASDNDSWSVGYSQGYAEYIVSNGPGNEFNISCNENAENGSTGILIDIVGKRPPGGSKINVVLDGDEISFMADSSGAIETDCHVCADSFIALWKGLKTANTMLVQFSDGRSSKFTMKGASKVFKGAKCKVDYYSKKF